ncbi:MAG: hypothetical protein E6G42_09655 [Actinobacteria bacterium]|nr:MAG: hypothetical protein E6G42_09655 [Actinomycetota bacterium]
MSVLLSLRKWSLFAAILAALVVVLVPSALSASAAPTPPTICQRLPTSGLLPPGATASTPFEFSNTWQWSASSAHQPFRWALVRRDGVVVAAGSSAGAGGTIFVPLNYYRWQVTNQGNVGQFWTVCWSSGP